METKTLRTVNVGGTVKVEPVNTTGAMTPPGALEASTVSSITDFTAHVWVMTTTLPSGI